MQPFPLTRISVIAAAASDDAGERERALDAIARVYWTPSRAYLEARWSLSREDAEDLTQELFARAAEQRTFARYDATVARFRTFIRACLDAAAKNARVAAGRLKRGGDAVHLRIDTPSGAPDDGDAPALADERDMDELFRREWLRSLFTLATDDLRARCEELGKVRHWTIFERYDLGAHAAGERPTYAELGAELGLPSTQVTNFLAFARREFRRLLLARLRTLCATDAEYRDEARELLGVDVV